MALPITQTGKWRHREMMCSDQDLAAGQQWCEMSGQAGWALSLRFHRGMLLLGKASSGGQHVEGSLNTWLL